MGSVGPRQVYKVLAVKDVHETRAIMPYWQKDTAKWSIGTGVYENKFFDGRSHAPSLHHEMPVLGARAVTRNRLVSTVVQIL